jgi:S-adenosylmethionine/arginine decarboxylase-like enzyme
MAMKKIAPEIFRQRLVIEGVYREKVTKQKIRKYLKELSRLLGMTVIFGPRIMRNGEKYRMGQEGFEGLMVWVESGVSVYTWECRNFFTVDIYSCKKFSVEDAVCFTNDTFNASEIEFKEV